MLILYSVSDGPPSVAVRMALKLLNLEYKLQEVDFGTGEHLNDWYAELNPQKEIPVLHDDGFFLSESAAILQYLADKYSETDTIYPRNHKDRALVNHRLAFHLASYYRHIGEYVMAPIFFDYERTPLGLKKVQTVLDTFNTILEKQGTKYCAGENLTIADLLLASATMCLEAISMDLGAYPAVEKWYNTFKEENPSLWAVAEEAMKEIKYFNEIPPKFPHLHHPVHPVRK